ncbi:MAG TPA: DUF1801 domain-containing protein, partial [Chitinophagaceae bacterium]|nr:DUF1801 domain-containing protein [Chitinophagaceae bacterium]
KQPVGRKRILQKIHTIIIGEDMTVAPSVEKMMGKEMIIYKAGGMMKYALSSAKNYMSLHVLPVYGSPSLFTKYKTLLPRATFRKGCINFTDDSGMPLTAVKQLMADCSAIDLAKIRKEYLEQKSRKVK